MKTLLAATLALSALHAADLPFRDEFTSATLPVRRAVRGEWEMKGGIAACTQDDEVYKKFKNHGPVIWYDVPFENATVRFSYKALRSKTFVFTANGADGHVFRFVSNETGTDLRAFPPGSKTPPSIVLARGGPAIANGEWTAVVVELRGAKATVRIGKDYSATVEHPSLARGKTVIGLGFSFGSVGIKDFAIEP